MSNTFLYYVTLFLYRASQSMAVSFITGVTIISLSFNTFGQITVAGYVLDEHHLPLPGVNIILNNGAFGIATDGNGGFQFQNIPSGTYAIRVSAVGYQPFIKIFHTDTLVSTLSFTLTPSVSELSEVQIIETSEQFLKKTESFSVQIVDEEFITESVSSNLVQALGNLPGISSMDIGTGMSKPIIRGLGYYRVVVAQNGIKQEGQQWSNHHGIAIDQHAIQHVEIIKGPASLQYGSDAIGGVINVLSDPVPVPDGLIGDASFTGMTNTGWLGGSLSAACRKKNFYTDVVITYNNYGDFFIPATDSFLLPAPVSSAEASHKVVLGNQVYNTAGSEKAMMLTAGLLTNWGRSYLEFSYYSSSNGFFDYSGIQQDSIKAVHASAKRDLNLPWQKIDNYAMNYFLDRNFCSGKLEIALGYQSNSSYEYSYLTDRTGNRFEDLEYYRNSGNLDLQLWLQSWTGNVFYTLNRLNKQYLKFGLNTQYQFHQPDGYSHILPEYQRLATGAFFIYRYMFSPKWSLNTGARFDNTFFNMEESLNPDPEYGDSVFNPALRHNYPVSAFSCGVNFNLNKNTILKANLGKSYRVPSAYELGAYGLHRHEGRFEKGDPENDPEKAWQIDLALEHIRDPLFISISPFVNYFTNYLFLNPTPVLRPEGQVYEYQQTQAMLSGGEISFNYLIVKQWNIDFNAEFVYSVNLDLKSPLPFTPPFNAQTSISYLFKNIRSFSHTETGIELITVAKQKYTVPNELSTPGYNLLNLFASTDFLIGKQRLSVTFKIRNLLNNKYYDHLSFYRRLRIPEPGRDFQIFITIPFNYLIQTKI